MANARLNFPKRKHSGGSIAGADGALLGGFGVKSDPIGFLTVQSPEPTARFSGGVSAFLSSFRRLSSHTPAMIVQVTGAGVVSA